MGYCYDLRGRLACDACGAVGQVRKRTCPYRVHYGTGGSLPYCLPAALCPSCYAKHKATLHTTCKAGAAARTAEEQEKHARLVAGDLEVGAAWGDWHATVPEGYVGVYFRGLGRVTAYHLIAKDEYTPGTRRFLSDYPTVHPWTDPDTLTTKEVPVAEVRR